MDLATYSRTHRQVLAVSLPHLLDRVARPGVIADLGCGDGPILYALHQTDRLGPTSYAVDLSPDRVAAAEQAAPGVEGIVADATDTTLPDKSVDGVIVSQVIEHIPDDRQLAPEIARILKPGGWWYVGSVLRRPHAWWLYKQNGRRILDPTHVREYTSVRQFTNVLDHPDLTITATTVTRFHYPLTDLAARAVSPDRLHRMYVNHSWMTHARKLTIGPPGYRLLEAAGTKP